MNEPQVWTSIGVLASSLFAALALMSTLFVRVIQAEFGSVRSEIGSLRSEMTTEIGSLRSEMKAEIGSVRSEVRRVEEVMTARFTHLDRDVQAVARKVFGDDAA
ncbi:hypothetical protein [Aeromicrobium sp. Leaf350]|uniref:hypothetical protein n=1 Tax=Aeromicrobium sp. Leaf350 TaxID=2876565 RepID=UPI001E311F3E|nr:hypothetical protein [Aeromicrobium sp. Leaf350]